MDCCARSLKCPLWVGDRRSRGRGAVRCASATSLETSAHRTPAMRVNRIRYPNAVPLVVLAASIGGVLPLAAQSLHYAGTRRDSVADTYFGTRVPAPYRWFEDQNSPEVAAWGDAQNVVTFGYLGTIPLRDGFRRRLTELWNYARVGVPTREAGRAFV